MVIKALVAVRSGSVRVQNKNLRPFAGSSLLELKLRQLKRIKGLDGIIVNSNDDAMLKIGSDLGCETVKRDPYYASNSVFMSDVYENMAQNCDCDVIAYINCTNPLLKDETIEKAIEEFKAMEGFDSLNSAHLIKEFMFFENKPVNYDLLHQPRSQDLPDYYALNFAINIIKREYMIKYKNVVGHCPWIYGIDELEATDIDNQIDFDFAEFVYKRSTFQLPLIAHYETDDLIIRHDIQYSQPKSQTIDFRNVTNLRTKIRDSLKRLKNDFGVISIKAEFEAEGSRKDELIMLRELVEPAGLGLVIKIGGCEAVHDIDQCKLLDATGIMAPMIETPFALSKFRNAIRKVYGDEWNGIERIINAETISCHGNFDEILKEGKGFLTGVTVGRSDLSASMGITREHIEEAEVFNTTKTFCEKAKEAGLIANFGGNIGVESIPFIIKMASYIDRFETRKVILTKSNDSDFLKNAIIAALEFELLYLQLKSGYYSNMANEDSQRIVRLEKQINTVKITPPPHVE